jgi:alpha-tubulin suppressor-like RCC1 family protein
MTKTGRNAFAVLASLTLPVFAGCRGTEPAGGQAPVPPAPKRTWTDPPRESGPPRATQISLARDHGCARMSDDSLRCWGANDWHVQGSERAGTRQAPATATIGDVVEVAAGGSFSCVRRRDRSVWCWGYNHVGQLGTAPVEAKRGPAQLTGIHGAVSLAAGDQTACALVDDGRVRCWGDGWGPSGPVAVSGLTDAVAVHGKDFFCALRGDGSVWCWGANMGGARAAPVAGLPGSSAIAEISIGFLLGCARTARGALLCWGQNDSGQLGPGSEPGDFQSVPFPIAGLTGVTAVGAGSASVCAASDRALRCWGHEAANPAFPPDCLRMTSHHGGGGSPLQWRYCPVPTPLEGLSDAVQIQMGGPDICALTREGAVFCWGEDDRGRPAAPVQLSL